MASNIKAPEFRLLEIGGFPDSYNLQMVLG